jgi:hypothetical protein
MNNGPLSGLILPTICVVLAALGGYKVGQASSTSHSTQSPLGNTPDKENSGTSNATGDNDSEDEEQRRADGDLASVSTNGPCKMVSPSLLRVIVADFFYSISFKVLIVRTDLGMTKGKIAAQ